VLSHYWLGIGKNTWPVKKWVMRWWYSCLPGVRWKWFAYCPANATTTPVIICFIKTWWRLTQVVLEKRPLNRCLSVCLSVYESMVTTSGALCLLNYLRLVGAAKRSTGAKWIPLSRVCAVAQYAVLEANGKVNGISEITHPSPSPTLRPIWMSLQTYHYVPPGSRCAKFD